MLESCDCQCFVHYPQGALCWSTIDECCIFFNMQGSLSHCHRQGFSNKGMWVNRCQSPLEHYQTEQSIIAEYLRGVLPLHAQPHKMAH